MARRISSDETANGNVESNENKFSNEEFSVTQQPSISADEHHEDVDCFNVPNEIPHDDNPNPNILSSADKIEEIISLPSPLPAEPISSDAESQNCAPPEIRSSEVAVVDMLDSVEKSVDIIVENGNKNKNENENIVYQDSDKIFSDSKSLSTIDDKSADSELEVATTLQSLQTSTENSNIVVAESNVEEENENINDNANKIAEAKDFDDRITYSCSTENKENIITTLPINEIIENKVFIYIYMFKVFF
jgi:hypothetical protein